MTDGNGRNARIRAYVTRRFGTEPEVFESPLTVLASPAWRGVEADIWLVQKDDRAEIFKHYHDDTGGYVSPDAVFAAARQAAGVGAGPAVLDSSADDGVILVMEYLGQGWRAGGLHDVIVPEIRANVIAAKKAIQSGPDLPRDGDIIAEIRGLYELCVSHNADLPPNITAFMDYADRAGKALAAAGIDKRPCHRDGNTANLMIGPEQQVRLLDYDMAANSDPFEDIGCYLSEFFEGETDARNGFEEWYGHFDEGLFQRAQMYGLLDDLRWGLIASLMSASSPRKTLEFSKYGSWRFMRFAQMSQQSFAADRLRRLR